MVIVPETFFQLMKTFWNYDLILFLVVVLLCFWYLISTYIFRSLFFLSVNTDAKTSENITRNLKEFNLTDLERATNNFEEVLGRGPSGRVFIGWVDENTYAPTTPYTGLPIAVRRFIPDQQGHIEWQVIWLPYTPNSLNVDHHYLLFDLCSVEIIRIP